MNALYSAVIASCASATLAQTATMPPHASVFSGSTRGYYFTAPADFRITGVQVLQNPATSNQFMNWSVVRFDNATPPPLFSMTTNAFVQLGFGLDKSSASFDPTSIEVHAGEVIGVYGNTMATAGAPSGANSYTVAGVQATTTILGNVVNLGRSGMQFHLGSATSPQGMHDIWREAGLNISRVEFTYEALGAACYPDCDGDDLLSLADFGCFQTKFGLGDPYADCDGDGLLTLADFGCFQTGFGLGCP